MQDVDVGPIEDADTVWELVERRSAATPDGLALVDGAGHRLTFAGLEEAAKRAAAGCRDEGIDADTAVAWQLPTSIDSVVLSLALSRLGAVQSPLIPIYREREVGAVLDQAGIQRFFVPGRFRGFDHAAMAEGLAAKRAGLRVRCIESGLPDGDPAILPPAPRSADTVRWLYTTSGTTTEPKCVRHSDRTLMAGAIGLARALDAGPGDVGSIPFPFAHIGGPLYLIMMLMRGFGSLLLDTFVPGDAVAAIRREGVTMSGGSTAFYSAFVREQSLSGPARLMPSLRLLAGGGAPMPAGIYYQVKDTLGVVVAHGYGMTECPMIASGRPTDMDEQLANTEGKPVDGCRVRVVDPGSALPVGSGVEGEIQVSGPMLCLGYVRETASTHAFTADGWFRTGDLGILRADGHVVVTGRIKDLIIRKGENISPLQVEEVIGQMTGVSAVAVIGLPDAERGERICAVLELLPGTPPPDLEEVTGQCMKAGLARQKFPEQIETVSSLPRNATMKVLKHVLRQQMTDSLRAEAGGSGSTNGWNRPPGVKE